MKFHEISVKVTPGISNVEISEHYVVGSRKLAGDLLAGERAILIAGGTRENAPPSVGPYRRASVASFIHENHDGLLPPLARHHLLVVDRWNQCLCYV